MARRDDGHAGSQIDRFARTLREVANGRPAPEDGYAGTYIDEIAAAVNVLLTLAWRNNVVGWTSG